MAKNYYLPTEDTLRCTWFSNFAGKLGTYASDLEISPSDQASVVADCLFFAYVCDARNQFNQFAKDWTAYKNGARSGPTLGVMPVAPVLAAAPALVEPNIFLRITKLVNRIKNHPAYTDSMGQDLGIIGDEQTVDLNAMKPVLKVTLQAGHPNVGWTKQGMGGIDIYVDRGTGTFVFLAQDTIPDYLDTAALPSGSAVWKYKAIYRFNDEQVGQWSDVASISVMG